MSLCHHHTCIVHVWKCTVGCSWLAGDELFGWCLNRRYSTVAVPSQYWGIALGMLACDLGIAVILYRTSNREGSDSGAAQCCRVAALRISRYVQYPFGDC